MSVPTPEQRAAADPAVSAWVGANAGSGKTRVLIHRVARLLLAGSAPARILCLTYTRAAAAEMQTRLFAELGRWSMMPDEALAATIGGLTGGAAPSPAALDRARQLFALALETPGGLRIQTIHAFCESLIRRFPLEAGADPAFRVADDRDAAALAARVRGRLGAAAAGGDDDALDRLARRLAETSLDALSADIRRHRDTLPASPAAVADRLAPHYDATVLAAPDEVARAALAGIDRAALPGLRDRLARGGKTAEGVAAALDAALRMGPEAWHDDPQTVLQRLLAATHTAGTPRKPRSRVVTKGLAAADPALADDYAALQAATGAARARLDEGEAGRRAEDLNRFAAAWLAEYAEAKAAAGAMDFDDLIGLAAALLSTSEQAAWVLWRLDGGIDHILVDEAQDTAPAQWRVIEAIAAEFTAGAGAREGGRTLFVVGDEKQSIYSFQGADPQVFGAVRETTRTRLAPAAGAGGLAEPALARSFRSAPGILAFVDRVFAGDAARGLTLDGAPPVHQTSREGDGALIDLWSVLEPEETGEEAPWHAPVDRPPPAAPRPRLARIIAAEIERICREEALPARAAEAAPPPTRPGDILVLVRRRDALAGTLVRALRQRGVPVTGSDRLVLSRELAVQDLVAALSVAALPDDDLALATLIRSPLGDVDEDALMALAAGREGERLSARLAAAAERHPRAAALVADLMAQADYLRPYEMIERILVRHDGRARLVARLGPDCEDAIDELLTQALVYEAAEAPTLAGFIAWLGRGEDSVKREFGSEAGAVRIMTVHGAKGLEAPVVILPDTLALPGSGGRGRPQLLTLEAGGNRPALVTLAGRAGEDDARTAEARRLAEARELAEHKRLLYVALTRAERRLILCAAGSPPAAGKEGEDEGRAERRAAVWYTMLADAMGRSPDARTAPPPEGIATLTRLGPDPVSPPAPWAPPARAPAQLPDAPPWLGRAPAEARSPRPTPTGIAAGLAAGLGASAGDVPGPHLAGDGGDGIGAGSRPLAGPSGQARAGADPRLYGLAVHALLERPAVLEDVERARQLALGAAPGLEGAALDRAMAEAAAALALPEAAVFFGPGSIGEAALSMPLATEAPGGPRLVGRVDRLVIAPDRVLVADIKTDRPVPAGPGAVPPAYRAQLGAYAAALSAILPGRPIAPALLYTGGPRLLALDPDDCRAAWTRALAGAAR
ncbi:MAG: double-strand break repair helicase AddA [Pseudomonadota bacterium]